LLFAFGGCQWVVPIVLFFVLSGVLTRLTGAASRPGADLFAKGETRDELQVTANGGLASLLVVPWFLTGVDLYYIAYLGAVGAAAADTWATEIGMTSTRPPRSIRTLAAASPGESGAITPRGLLAAAAGGIVIALSASPWLGLQLAALGAVAGGAFAATLVDSVLGATLQIQYRCTRCGRKTERPGHCGVASRRWRGYPCITNDAVNLLASSSGAGLAVALVLAWR
jgi:uncharacterized protein (TIGR00297 family)